MSNRKPTRRDLLQVIGRLQHLVGSAMSVNHDRNPHSHAQTTAALEDAHSLCIEALGQDPPEASDPSGIGWGDNSNDNRYKRRV